MLRCVYLFGISGKNQRAHLGFTNTFTIELIEYFLYRDLDLKNLKLRPHTPSWSVKVI